MKQIAASFQAVAIDDRGKRTPVPMAREPLYRWTDPTRENNDGALDLAIDGPAGRGRGDRALPAEPGVRHGLGARVHLAVDRAARGRGRRAINRSYPDMYAPRPDGTLRWAPVKGGLAFREIPDAPSPVAGQAERLRQMRDLAKRFSAQFYNINSQNYTLRLIAHPIDRYADAASGLVDGAIFAFANGTNPEVLLIIEAQRRGGGAPAWSYAAAPLTRPEPTLRLGRQDVWTHPFKEVPAPEIPDFLARKPQAPSARD